MDITFTKWVTRNRTVKYFP